jgi:hypothetical protein
MCGCSDTPAHRQRTDGEELDRMRDEPEDRRPHPSGRLVEAGSHEGRRDPVSKWQSGLSFAVSASGSGGRIAA